MILPPTLASLLGAVQCSAVQCSAVQCSAVQCSIHTMILPPTLASLLGAVQCSAVQCGRPIRGQDGAQLGFSLVVVVKIVTEHGRRKTVF